MTDSEHNAFSALLGQVMAFYRYRDASAFAVEVWWNALRSYPLSVVRGAFSACTRATPSAAPSHRCPPTSFDTSRAAATNPRAARLGTACCAPSRDVGHYASVDLGDPLAARRHRRPRRLGAPVLPADRRARLRPPALRRVLPRAPGRGRCAGRHAAAPRRRARGEERGPRLHGAQRSPIRHAARARAQARPGAARGDARHGESSDRRVEAPVLPAPRRSCIRTQPLRRRDLRAPRKRSCGVASAVGSLVFMDELNESQATAKGSTP